MSFDDILDRLLSVGGRTPRQVARTVIIYLAVLYLLGKISLDVFKYGLKKTIVKYFFAAYMSYQGKQGVSNQLDEIEQKFEDAIIPLEVRECDDEEKFAIIPDESITREKILSLVRKWSAIEQPKWKERNVTGAVYHGGDDLAALQSEVFTLYALSNPLHADLWPYLRKMESEIISMTLDFFHGDIRQSLAMKQQPRSCGLVTTGGTESIMLAIRAYKNWALQEKNIHAPELVFPSSAHAAFFKGCDLMDITPVLVDVHGPSWTVDPANVVSKITSNTIAIVGSTPNYPYGTMDPIFELSKIAVEHQIGLHVDCCLGSFLMPTIEKYNLGRVAIKPFDFRCPGVTTISCDTHKYGYSIKGSSVLMFRDKELRRFCYFSYPNWVGGMYSTPTFGGSRAGGIIAATWASLLSVGMKGHEENARQIMDTVDTMVRGLEAMEEIEIMGQPVSSVFAFRVRPEYENSINIFKVSECLDKHRNWHLAPLQYPTGIHLATTFLHAGKGQDFVDSVRYALDYVSEHPDEFEGGSASFYGTAVTIPAGDFKLGILHRYIDVCYNVY